MGNLRRHLDEVFSKKVYPNPATPETAAKLADGLKEFEQNYLGKNFLWKLAGMGLGAYASSGFFYTRAPFNRHMVVGRFPRFEVGDIPDPNKLLQSVRLAGLRFAAEVNWKQRIELLCEISRVVKERFWLLCAAKMYETGQSIAEAIGETDEEVDFPLAAAMYLEEIHEELLLKSPAWSGDFSGKRYVPHGVFLNISPFNFPGAIPMDMAVKALAMGNAIIEKSSDKSSLCGYLVFESIIIAFNRLGISHRGVVNYCPGGPDVVDMLLASPDIAGVSFTGSSAALEQIKSKHGSKPRNKFHGTSPLTFGSAETSGVNIAIVWHDADVSHAASECAKSFLGRQGQKCSSARIIMVHERVLEGFKTALEGAIEKVRFGSVIKGADVGPVITEDAERKIIKGIESLFFAGVTEKYVKHTNISTSPSCRVLPTILYTEKDRPKKMIAAQRLMNTEIFGPVTTVVSVSNLEMVKKLCALSEFALTGTGFTADPELATELTNIIPAGNLYLNRKCTGALVESECFGGLSSRSSPSGIKGKQALSLFGSEQITSGFYPKSWSIEQRHAFVEKMKEKHGVVFSKV